MDRPQCRPAAILRCFLFVAVALFLAPVSALSVNSTILVIAGDSATAGILTSGLRGYGIPYDIFLSTSKTLPALNTSTSSGKYGGILMINEVLTAAQLTTVYAYQLAFGVRLARLNAVPSANFGTDYAVAATGCCASAVEQLVSITNTTGFATSGMKTGAGVSTLGMYHTPAVIKDSSTTWQIASFAASGSFKSATVAAVINNFSGRQQMVWFMPFDTTWSPSSTFLQHSWIHFVTRGLYTGFRRLTLSTQVDDSFLVTDMYSPNGTSFRVRGADITGHISWMTTINKQMPSGSDYFIEIGHNGNGNIEGPTPDADDSNRDKVCKPGSIEYADQPDETASSIEYKKPVGTGKNLWPSSPSTYQYTDECLQLDDYEVFWQTDSNLNAFAHLSHTFTHEDLTNATYSDANKEISWNLQWLTQTGIAAATRFSPNGLIPPAITGLHNGDAIRAFMDNGVLGVVGDNSRPSLLNTQNEYWPKITTVAADGYAGLPIIGRWPTNIYYNCDTMACDLAEWQFVSKPGGTWNQLMANELSTNTKNLFALRQDPFMFHQPNLRYSDIGTSTVNGVSAKRSLLMIWVETIVAELTRLTTWPIISFKHDDMVQNWLNRMTRDQCLPNLTYNYASGSNGLSITSVTVAAFSATCGAQIPITFPVSVKSAGSATQEQVGSDPLTLWVTYSGKPQTFELSTPVAA